MSGVSGKIRIGTRKSALAKFQSNQVKHELETLGLACELVEIVSSGDVDRKTPLYEIELSSPGLFTKQLETALLENKIDLAVHSLKDLPTTQPKGLKVAAVSKRVDASDCLLVRASRYDASKLLGLPEGATVGTSSLRREAQLLSERPDVRVVPVRGNVPTRCEKARDGEVDATILAEAGIGRLGLKLEGLVKVHLPSDHFVPAPGQGALALETRSDIPKQLEMALAKLNAIEAETETRVERRVLQALEGGCTLPLGVRCTVHPPHGLWLRAFLGTTEAGREKGPRRWTGFHRFEATDQNVAALIEKTVGHFKDIMEGNA
jgi:hydroxymethylbilane synthase